jgi:transcription elongation GreA/GreB family factor
VKKIVLKKLNELVGSRLESTRKSIEEAIESRDEETKNTMGDKYETGRAMVEMEMDKLHEQLDQLIKQKKVLSNLKSDTVLDHVDFGSLVETNLGKYFIAVGLGMLTVENEKIYCISLASPVGQAIRDKKAGEKVNFQGRDIVIKNVI